MDHFLARAVLHEPGFHVAQIQRSAEQFDRFAETHRRLGFHQRAEFSGDFVHGIGAQAHGHAFPGTHRVDCQWKWRDLSVDSRFLDQQRLAAGGRFHLAVGEFADLEFGSDGNGDGNEFTGAIQLLHKFPEGFKCHTHESVTDQRRAATGVSPGVGRALLDHFAASRRPGRLCGREDASDE